MCGIKIVHQSVREFLVNYFEQITNYGIYYKKVYSLFNSLIYAGRNRKQFCVSVLQNVWTINMEETYIKGRVMGPIMFFK